MTNDEALVEQLKTAWRQAPLSAQDRAMLTYTEKLTLEPWAMVKEDVDALRRRL